MCYILGVLIIIVSLVISYFNRSIDVSQVLLSVVYAIFGLAGILIGGKTIQNVKDAKYIYGGNNEKMDNELDKKDIFKG